MKIINRILSDLILACTTVLYVYAAGTAPKSGGEPLSVTDPTAAVPAPHKTPEFLHRMPRDVNDSTDSSRIQSLYGREHTPAEEVGDYRADERDSSSNAWKIPIPAIAGTGFPLLQEPDSAPRLFAHAAGNERFFWLKPPAVRNSSKASKKKPGQLFSLKPVHMGDDSMDERIKTGAYHYDIVQKTGWRDWIKPEAISDQWDGFLIYGTDAAPVALISFNF